MATQTAALECTQFAVVDSGSPRENYHGAENYMLTKSTYYFFRRALLSFAALPEAASRYRIISADLKCSFSPEGVLPGLGSYYATIRRLYSSGFDEETVTYNTLPDSLLVPYDRQMINGSEVLTQTLEISDAGTDEGTANSLKVLRGYGLQVELGFAGQYTSGEVGIYTRAAALALRPELIVSFDDSLLVQSQIKVNSAPTSGYLNPRAPQTFRWTYSLVSDICLAKTAKQASATLYWKAADSAEYTAVRVEGETTSTTIPANTFPAMTTVQWYLEGTDSFGVTSQTQIYTASTTDSMQTATPISPVGTVEDGSDEIGLVWQESNDSGTAPTGADLQISTDGSAWTDLAHVAGAATQYTAPAGTFQGGTAYWRVRAYNSDGAAGSWSETAAFISVAAPPSPVVTVNSAPFATISWQSDGQKAWRVTVDGTVYGPYFGTGKSFTLPDFLADGEHTAQVEVQGSFGLWSQAGEVTFTVANTPGDAVQLSGVFSRDAQLSWNTASQTADFLIYRDGIRIGHTSGSNFTDRVTLGQHSWQVINRLPGGMYTASNIVQGELESCGLAVAPLAGGEWLELTKSASSTREIGTTISQAASARHFAGEIWPSAEVAPYRDQAVSFDAAWLQREKTQAAAFEALIGQTVILKAPDGSCVVGLLSAVSRRSQVFFRAYTSTVTRVKWRDYIDADR